MKEIKIWKIILIWFMTPFFITLGAVLLNPYEDINDLMLMFISFLLMLLIILVIGKVNTKLARERYNDLKYKVNIKEIIVVVATQIFLSIGLSNLSVGFIAIKDTEKALLALNDTFSNPNTNIELILWIITAIILAPILEEIVFRRVLFTRLSKKLGFFMASTISSVIFGFGHDVLAIFGAIVFGYACCILYKKYNNILVPIAVHFINNLLAGIFMCIDYFRETLNTHIEAITNSDIKTYFILGIVFTIISLIVFVKFIIQNKKYLKKVKIEALGV